ncbi:MAG: glycosyltransferase family 2 protein [Acidobacteria bacterium]|nr:glycosyltransferase family 2 protein [Acidobacteriota bacterium]
MNSSRFPYSLSVFFPAFNDAPSLPKLIGATFETLAAHVDDFEVIVVNDGSSDNTADVLRQLKQLHGERLKVVTHRINRGYGGALRSGFAAASKEFVFYTDGDGQYDVTQLPALLFHAGPDVGLVNGFKIKRHDPWHRIVIGALYNQFARRLFRVRLRDIDCDYRLIRNAMLKSINLTCTSGTICVELVKKIEATGTRVVEVPVSHLAREHGRSQFFRLKSLATTFVQLLDLHRKLVLRPWIEAWRQRITRISVAGHS